jgi:hypothetical protein
VVIKRIALSCSSCITSSSSSSICVTLVVLKLESALMIGGLVVVLSRLSKLVGFESYNSEDTPQRLQSCKK